MKKWVFVPVICLVLLIGAGYYRNENVSNKSTDSEIYKITRDRWTNTAWVETYAYAGTVKTYSISPVNSQTNEDDAKLLQQRQAWSNRWKLSIFITSVLSTLGGVSLFVGKTPAKNS